MTVVIIIIVLLSLLFIGFIVNRNESKAISVVFNFVGEFFERFLNYSFNDKERTQENYKWLLGRVDRVQTHLGAGDLANYQPEFDKYVRNHSKVIPELVNKLGTASLPRGIDLETARNLIFRYLANLEVVIEKKKKELYNPLIWLRVGVQFIISIPLSILHWFGLIDYSKVVNVRNNYIIKLISSLIGAVIVIVGFIDGILNIYNNWGLITNFILSALHLPQN